MSFIWNLIQIIIIIIIISCFSLLIRYIILHSKHWFWSPYLQSDNLSNPYFVMNASVTIDWTHSSQFAIITEFLPPFNFFLKQPIKHLKCIVNWGFFHCFTQEDELKCSNYMNTIWNKTDIQLNLWIQYTIIMRSCLHGNIKISFCNYTLLEYCWGVCPKGATTMPMVYGR